MNEYTRIYESKELCIVRNDQEKQRVMNFCAIHDIDCFPYQIDECKYKILVEKIDDDTLRSMRDSLAGVLWSMRCDNR